MPHLHNFRIAACALALVAASTRGEDLTAESSALPAFAGAPNQSLAPHERAPASISAGSRKHVLGLQLDAGVPDGASATILYRPLEFLRAGGGLLYNYAGYGVRGGITVLPHFPIAPSLSLEVGHYFEANAASRFSRFFTISDDLRPLLQRVGYTFVDASIGLELGSPDRFVFFVRGGLSRVWLSVHGVEAAAKQLSSGDVRVSHADEPSVRLAMPNVKLGVVMFLY